MSEFICVKQNLTSVSKASGSLRVRKPSPRCSEQCEKCAAIVPCPFEIRERVCKDCDNPYDPESSLGDDFKQCQACFEGACVVGPGQ